MDNVYVYIYMHGWDISVYSYIFMAIWYFFKIFLDIWSNFRAMKQMGPG